MIAEGRLGGGSAVRNGARTGCLVAGLAMAVAAPAEAACDGGRPLDNPTSAYRLQGATALDTRTGLEWQRCSLGMTWTGAGCTGQPAALTHDQAVAAAAALGRGWRMPTAPELDGLVEGACDTPAVNRTVFPDIPAVAAEDELSWNYWSSTADDTMTEMVFVFDFRTGIADIHSKGFRLLVRPVRPSTGYR